MSGFVNKTIGQVIQAAAERYPENPALIQPKFKIRQNYRDFYASCREIAKGFMVMGVKRGDKISVWTTNVPQWVYLQYSLGMTGGILVTVNTNYQSHELEYILKQSDSSTLFLIDSYRDTSFYDTVRKIMPEVDSCKPGSLVCAKLPLMKNLIYIGEKTSTPGMFKFNDLIDMGKRITDQELEARMNSLSDQDVINMQYTSGTAGFPRVSC